MIQRDYIERLIEQCADFLRRVLELRTAGQFEPALRVVHDAEHEVAGRLLPLLERLEAGSAVEVAGLADRERVRLFASLVSEEAVIYWDLGDAASAYLCGRRALELFAALMLAGTPLDDADRLRVAAASRIVDPTELKPEYAAAIRRLQAGA